MLLPVLPKRIRTFNSARHSRIDREVGARLLLFSRLHRRRALELSIRRKDWPGLTRCSVVESHVFDRLWPYIQVSRLKWQSIWRAGGTRTIGQRAEVLGRGG